MQLRIYLIFNEQLIAFSVACSACSLGFIQATLEPHMRDFNLSPLVIGSMFVISGGCYGNKINFMIIILMYVINTFPTGFSAPLWGLICDKRNPKLVTFAGEQNQLNWFCAGIKIV